MAYLKDLIRRLVARAYVALGGDLHDLTRRANRLLVSDLVEPSDSTPEERLAFLGKMVTLEMSPELAWLMAELTKDQKELSFEEAQGLTHLEWGRATVNGLMLLRDRLSKYRAEFDELNRKQEAFNPHSPI